MNVAIRGTQQNKETQPFRGMVDNIHNIARFGLILYVYYTPKPNSALPYIKKATVATRFGTSECTVLFVSRTSL